MGCNRFWDYGKEMKLPAVSVVIPAYNHARYVAEAIQSILDQTFQDFELILIDEGERASQDEFVTQWPMVPYETKEEIFPSLRNEPGEAARARAYEKLAGYAEKSGIPVQVPIAQIYRELGKSPESDSFPLPGAMGRVEAKDGTVHPLRGKGGRIHLLIETLTLDKGGLEQVIFNLAKGLDGDLFRVIVVAVDQGGLIADRCKKIGIPVEILKYDKEKEYHEVLERYQIDLVMSHYSTFGAKLAFEKGIPTLSVIHNIYSWFPDNIFSDFKSADPFVSRYIAVSEEVKQYAMYRFNISPEKIVVIPNGIDLEEYWAQPSSKTIRRTEWNLKDEDYVFINIASIGPPKGQNVILAALERVVKEYPQIKVLSLGGVLDEAYSRFLTEWIEERGLSEHFKRVGFVDDVRPYLQIADAYLSTSLIEGWPLSVMEAMLHQLPVVVTQVGGVSEMLGESGAGMLLPNSYEDFRSLDIPSLDQLSRETSPRNTEDVVQAMKNFYEEKEFWRRAGKRGSKRISKRFHLEGMIQSYVRELLSLYVSMKKIGGFELLKKIRGQENLIQERERFTEEQGRLIQEQSRFNRDQERFTRDQGKLIQEQERFTQEQERLVQEQERFTQEREKLVQDQERFTQGQEKLVQEREGFTQEREKLVQEQERFTRDQEGLILERGRLAQEQEKLIGERERLTQDQEKIIQEREKIEQENGKKIEELQGQLASIRQRLDSKADLLESKIDANYRNIGWQLDYILIRLSLKERLKGVVYRSIKRIHKLVPVSIREKYQKGYRRLFFDKVVPLDQKPFEVPPPVEIPEPPKPIVPPQPPVQESSLAQDTKIEEKKGEERRENVGTPVLERNPMQDFWAFKEEIRTGLTSKPETFKTPHLPGLVSVVLPVYNQAYLLAGAIESVLNQTYTNLELIIVNDGSTDEVEKVLGPYRGHPKVKILDQENQKLPRALSNGFRSARGEFYTWTSADNLMGQRQLETQLEFLALHSGIQMVYANYDLINDDGEPLLYSDYCPGYQRPPGSNHIHLPQDLGELNVVRNNYIGPCFMYRSWVGRLIGDYDATMFTLEDYDYWMTVNALFRIEHLGHGDSLYFNRVHADSLTGRKKELKIVENTDRLMEFEKVRREFYREKFNIYLLGNNDRLKEMQGPLRANGNGVRPFRIPCGETRMEEGKALGLWIESATEKGFVRRVMAENPHAFFVVLRLDPQGSVDHEFLKQFGMRVAITDKIPGSDQGAQWFFAEELTSILYPMLCKANIELFRRKDSFARWTV